jgi:hypothetical protein
VDVGVHARTVGAVWASRRCKLGKAAVAAARVDRPEAIRTVAERNGQPVGRITEVSVLDPYF